MSQKLKIAELKPYKKNDHFFDDISGDAWTEFVDSIRNSGVIEPIVVTQNKVIVSGHQRVRACKLLEIEEIDAEVKIFDSEDEITKCLIETNIRQRGIGNTNPVKFGRCLKELERIYGIHQGNGSNQHEQKPQVADNATVTQSDLASQFGMSVDTLNRYKQLADSIPEIQSLVETGIVTPSVARAIMKKLPEFQQKELAKQFSDTGAKATKKQIEEAVAEIKSKLLSEKKSAIKEVSKRIEEREKEIADLKSKIDEMNTTNQSNGSSQRERFEKARADRLQADKEKLEKLVAELKESANRKTSNEAAVLKQQILTNAKMELADFVTKYSDMLDVKSMLIKMADSL